MKKFIIQKSSTQPNVWVLTDTENKVFITFKDGFFKESWKVTQSKDSKADAEDLAHIVNAMSEWAVRHHSSKVFNKTYGCEVSEDNKTCFVYRRKGPRWRLEIQESKVTPGSLADSLRKAAEFILKGNKNER